MKIKPNKMLGRFKKNTLISIVSSKKDFSLEFLKWGMKDGKNCVFVSTNVDKKVTENELKEILINNDVDSRIRFIDCSGRKHSLNVYISNLKNLSHLNVVLTQSLADLMSSESRICILDSLSEIEENNKPEDLFKFIEILTDIAKKYDTTTLLFSDKESKKLKNFMDKVILIE